MGETKHQGPIKATKKPQPKHWVSPIPFGLGKVKPHHFRDTVKIAWENKDNLRYASKILHRVFVMAVLSGFQDYMIKH